MALPARQEGWPRGALFDQPHSSAEAGEAINRSVEGSLRRSWRPGKELSDALKTGEELDPAGAARVRQRLESDPNSLEARAILLAWEARPKPENNDESRQLRAGQIAFLVGNAPDSDILGSPLVLLNNVPTDPLSDSAGYEQVRTLWLNQLALSSGNPTVIAHAVNFLRVPDPEKTEQLLLPVVNKVEGAPVWLGDLYGLAALGVTGLDLKTGLPARAGERLPETAFAQKARSTLASTVDARVLFSALATVTAGGRSLAKLGRLPAGYADFCGTLLNRARQIFPDTSASCDPSASVPDDRSAVNSPVSRIRIGGKVAQANLIKQVRPVYPSAAKAQHIQGTVRFSVLIDKEGKIRSLLLISGPLALYESARDAVLQWVYKPTRLNGEPVEVVTVADINYEMRQ